MGSSRPHVPEVLVTRSPAPPPGFPARPARPGPVRRGGAVPDPTVPGPAAPGPAAPGPAAPAPVRSGPGRPGPVGDAAPAAGLPRPEEVHVLVLGLDGITAAAALHLLRCGVLSLNVNDPGPVTETDLGTGAYSRGDLGRPREAALRGRLRAQDPRCAPVSGPELFPGPLLPGCLVLRGGVHDAGGRTLRPDPGDVAAPEHPLLSVHSVPGAVVRWPVVAWAHRPCPDCLRATLAAVPRAGTGRREQVLAAWARPAFGAAVAARLAAEALAVALPSLDGGRPLPGGGGPGRAEVLRPPFPAGSEPLAIDRRSCLCGLGQDLPGARG
ncbi:hypothetical protein KFL01_08060 [Kocuria flava]|uniref:THIF-type NAD/FAD binding fold domain-containing protein n=1 Tax=Kocuria flava TaxID=446860 RepID=A0ABQ0X2H9_9MICC|nr:hypothetical protein KFL01_08060 [Kocuria flava]